MKEIERKILEIDKKALIRRLRQLKARKLFEGLVRVKYFDYADKRILAKKDLLRVREFIRRGKVSFTEIVYKTYGGIKKRSKVFDEVEAKVFGPKAFSGLCGFLLKIGLKQVLYYEKMRTLYRIKDIKIEIDEHPGIPAFAEIEAASPKIINNAVRLLGLGGFEQSAETIAELIKRKYPTVKLNGLKFKPCRGFTYNTG